jgi:DNA polymerase
MAMLDARRARIWTAMGLGPYWLERGRTARGAADAAVPVVSVQGVPNGLPLPERMPDSTGASAASLTAAPAAAEDSRVSAISAMSWSELEEAVVSCTACGLCKSRKQTVFGVGRRTAGWMLVGEAPGAEEDARGEPLVGQAGRLLDNMLAAVGLSREAAADDPDSAVFIANVLKCRPPGNRNPEPGEVARCEPFLQRQLALVQPRVVVVMGRFAAQSLLRTDASIASLRGRVHRIDVAGRGIPVIVTYHPAYLLRNLADKAKSWADLCLARDVYAGGRA